MLKFDSFTNDPDLPKKILIGSLLALTGIGMIPVMGWAIAGILAKTPPYGPVGRISAATKKALNPFNAWRIFKVNFTGFFLAWNLGTLTSIVLGMLGTILCLVGVFPAFVLTYGLMGQYFGIAYRDAMEKLTVE